MVLILYLNIACCYMRMNFFEEAQLIIERAKTIAPTNSIVLYRSAQCISTNLESTIPALKNALSDIQKGIDSKKTEKIFQHEAGILGVIGLGNHKEAFQEMKVYVEGRIKEMRERNKAMVEKVVKRVQELNEIEARIIAEGKVPEDGPCMYRMFGSEDENMEHFILNE